MTLDYPFSQYVRIFGIGRNGARSLTRAEARAAMAMICSDDPYGPATQWWRTRAALPSQQLRVCVQ